MPRIEWDASFSVNNEELDEQHKKWIDIYNKMHEGLMGTDRPELKQIAAESLQAMQDYARYHFKTEEEFMQKIGYPDLIKHKRIHKDFDSLIFQYNRNVSDGELVLNTKIIEMIKKWLLEHILIEDKKYVPYIDEYENQLNEVGKD